jgi:hypothetical protein
MLVQAHACVRMLVSYGSETMRSIKEQLVVAEDLLSRISKGEIAPENHAERIRQYFAGFERRQLMRSSQASTPKPSGMTVRNGQRNGS